MEINLTKYERETVVVFNEAEADAELYTTSQVTIRRMDKLVEKYPVFSVVKQDKVSKTYRFPKKYFKVRNPSTREGQKPNFGRSEEMEG